MASVVPSFFELALPAEVVESDLEQYLKFEVCYTPRHWASLYNLGRLGPLVQALEFGIPSGVAICFFCCCWIMLGLQALEKKGDEFRYTGGSPV